MIKRGWGPLNDIDFCITNEIRVEWGNAIPQYLR